VNLITSVIMARVRLVLASASPRRAELLRAAGFVFDTCAVAVDERVRPGESPDAYVRRLAMEKSARAMAVVTASRTRSSEGSGEEPSDPMVVLGADTGVVIDGEILGKPRDDPDAEGMLRRLSGRRHEVMTGVSLRWGVVELGAVVSTAVDCHALTDADVAWYVASGEGRDKAGAYAIQGLASRFIPHIEGSYSNVVGLPIACVCELFERIRAG
jgi:nucleoside triphosphate pyrophosphatase